MDSIVISYKLSISGPDQDGDFELEWQNEHGWPEYHYITREQADKLLEILQPLAGTEL